MLLILVGVVFGYRMWDQRRQARARVFTTLDDAARVLGGVLHGAATEDPETRWRRTRWVEFTEAGQRYRLFREHRPGATTTQLACVVEALDHKHQGAAVDLRQNLVQSAPKTGLGPDAPALGPMALESLVDDEETRRLLRFALDHKDARFHLSGQGCWFECAGFAENGELAAATARTAARALGALAEVSVVKKKTPSS